MKYFNFKRYKFSTVFKNINFKRYNFYKFYKYFNFKAYNFSKVYKYFDFKGYNFSKVYKYLDFRRYNFYKIYKYLDFRRYNFSKITKLISFKRYKQIPIYFFSFIILSIFIYLAAPIFYNYEKTSVENILCKDLNVKCSIKGKINYSFFPSPRIKVNNLNLSSLKEKSTNIGKVENVEIKISVYNLLNKKKFNFTGINLKNAKFDFDLSNFKQYTKILKNDSYSYPVILKKSEINFLDKKQFVASIKNINLKYKNKKNKDKISLKGKFLGDSINIKFENNKSNKEMSKKFVLKLAKSNLYAKVDIPNSNLNNSDTVSGSILFKQNKNRVTTMFDYKNNEIKLKSGNLRNTFLDGKLSGNIKFLPFFDFNLDVNLNGLNFNKFYSFFVSLNPKDVFKLNKKINGKLNLSTNKVYSKYNLINSFESRFKFINGNITVEQLLLNMGKIGAADVTGVIKNDKKFAKFVFENNIFIDNLKRFYSKFGIYNKEKTSSSLFINGSFDLENLNLRFQEISNEEKLANDDVVYIEREFNDIMLTDGYVSLFDFVKLKEFIQQVVSSTN